MSTVSRIIAIWSVVLPSIATGISFPICAKSLMEVNLIATETISSMFAKCSKELSPIATAT